ncbi:orexin/Hypocretin receptor type 1-like isoform X2 [Montipora capricornis]|uniref:orexin/Hypocretin receptor type 1-like isoform X2 n=1 Tax=Montipora capricornis TaxID=246305 RepID=UPI0035F17DD0
MNSTNGNAPIDPDALPMTVLYCITIVVALAGNLLLLFIVTRRPETRTITSYLFVNMAAADLLVTLIVMPMAMVVPYTEMSWVSGLVGNITCKGVYYAFHVTIAASVLSLMLMALDRYLAVCYPLRRYATFRRANVLTFVTWLTSMVVMIPAGVLWKVKQFPPDGVYYCLPAFADTFGDFNKGVRIFYIYLFILVFLIPLMIISVLYGMVCRELWRRKLPGVISSETEGRHVIMKRKVVRTLITVTVAFALCWLPTQTFHLFVAFNIELYRELPRTVAFICIWCGHANSAINAWLYMMLTDKFRTALQDILRGKKSGIRTRSFRNQSSTKYTTVRESTSIRRHAQNHQDKGEELVKEPVEETAM